MLINIHQGNLKGTDSMETQGDRSKGEGGTLEHFFKSFYCKGTKRDRRMRH